MNKGEETRMAILNSALSLAESLGLEGITIGKLAKEVGLSKSGLFAHFESKEGLQVQILQEISSRFTQDVVQPSLRMPRGIPRLQELFFRWIAELDYHEASGRCLIMHGTAEFDDRPGVVRDELVGLQQQLSRTILRILQTTVDEGHLHADLDQKQFLFEFHSIIFAFYQYSRFHQHPKAFQYAKQAFKRLIHSYSA